MTEELEIWLLNEIKRTKEKLHNLEQIHIRLFDTGPG